MSSKWTLTIRDTGRLDTPASVRLRKALKVLLRTLGFECTRIIETGEAIDLTPVEKVSDK